MTLVPALRLDYWRDEKGQLELTTPTGMNTQQFPSREGDPAQPAARGAVASRRSLALRASVNRAFRAPTLGELYRPFTVGTVSTAANPALTAETLVEAEAGVEWSPVRVVRARATGSGTSCTTRSRTSPSSQPLPDGSTRQRQNLGKARVQGLDLAVEAHAAHGWELRAGYTLVDSRVLEAAKAPGTIGKRLPQDPVHRIAGSVER